MEIKGKICVVTGGASGIGEATARAFAKAGARAVADYALRRARAGSLAEGFGEAPGAG